MKKFKIIQTWLYHERIIYLCQIGDKYQLFYRSSGLAGHDSKGMILPHLLLKDTQHVSPDGLGFFMNFGWIVKYYRFNGSLVEYRSKHISEFPKSMHPYLKELENTDLDELKVQEQPDPKEINRFCQKYIKTEDDYVDWTLDV